MSDPVMREDWDALIEVLDMAIKRLDDKKTEPVKQSLLEFSSTAAMLGLNDLAAAAVRFQEFLKEDVGPHWEDEAASTLVLSMKGLRDSMDAHEYGPQFSSGMKEFIAYLGYYREGRAAPMPPAPEVDSVEEPREPGSPGDGPASDDAVEPEVEISGEAEEQATAAEERAIPRTEFSSPPYYETPDYETPADLPVERSEAKDETETDAKWGEKAKLPPAPPPEAPEDVPAFVVDKVYWYRQLLRLDPTSRVFVPLAEEFCTQSKWSDAIDVCRQGLAFHPQNLRGRVLLGWALWESGDLDEGEYILRDARQDLEQNALLYRVLAEAAQRRGESERTAEMRTLYHALQPGPDRPVFTAPPEPCPASLFVIHAFEEPDGEIEMIVSGFERETPGAEVKEPEMEIPAEAETEAEAAPPAALSIGSFCKFLEQYTRKPPRESNLSSLFSQEDRETLKRILLRKTA